MRQAAAWLPALLAGALLVATAPAAAALDLDRRRMLSAEESVPWRGVGRVNIASFDERGMCTGTLIAETLVLTAAHCVTSPRTGEPYPPGNIHFVAGWRLGQQTAFSKAESVTVHPGYDHAVRPGLEQIGSDLALIRLETGIPEEKAPSFRVAPTPPRRVPLTLISYRRDRAHALTRQEGCEIRGERGSVIALACDVTFGASGSPIFAEIEGERRLIAVVSAMSRDDGQPIAWAVRVDAAIPEVLAALD
jgi:protease YdgD